MVTVTQRIREQIELFFQPAKESIQEQITAVTGKKPRPKFISPPTIKDGFIPDPSVQQEIARRQRASRRRVRGFQTGSEEDIAQRIRLQQEARQKAIEDARIEEEKAKRKLELMKKQLEKQRRNKVLQAIRERNTKLKKAKTTTQKRVIQQIGQQEISQINQTAKRLKENIEVGLKKIKTISKKLPLLKDTTKKRLIKAFDSISGGSITERNINKKETRLIDKIKEFNKKFGDRELPEKEFNSAKAQSDLLKIQQNNINKEKDALANSLKNKIGRFIGTVAPFGRLTPKERQEEFKKIPKLEREIIEFKNKKRNLEKNKPQFYKIKIRGINSQIIGRENDIARINRGEGIKVLMGDFPIIPATGIPSGVTKVVFLGKQKILKNGKVVTDIIFKTSRGQVGLARGVSVSKGSAGQSVVLGKFANHGVKFPSKIVKIGKVKTFLGIEKTKITPKIFKTKKVFDIIKKSKKTGQILTIKRNVEGMLQRGFGKLITVKGRKFIRTAIRFPSGKLIKQKVPGVDLDDFASISSVFTRKDLNLIVGKSITRKGAKSKFVGLIKGTSNIKKISFTASENKQFTTALKRVVSVTGSALAEAEKTKGITKIASLAKASNIISTATSKARGKPTLQQIKQVSIKTKVIQPTKKAVPKAIRITKTKQKALQKQKIKQKVLQKQKQKVLQKQQVKQKALQKVKQKLQQATKTKQRQKLVQKQKSLQKQKQRLVLKQKQIQKKISRGITPTIKTLFPIKKFPLIPFVIPKGFKKKTLSKKVQGFLVKIKKRGKIINLTPKPLKLNHAKDFLAYHVDHNLVRSGWFQPLGKTKVVVIPPKNIQGYFNKVKHKLRPYKIRIGKKKKILNGYIEKKKFIGDTRREIKQLQASRKGRRKKSKKKLKRRNIRKGDQKRKGRKNKRSHKIKSRRRVRRKGNQSKNGRRRKSRRKIKKRVVRRRPVKRRRRAKIKSNKRRPVKKPFNIKRKKPTRRRNKKRVVRKGNQKRKGKRRKISFIGKLPGRRKKSIRRRTKKPLNIKRKKSKKRVVRRRPNKRGKIQRKKRRVKKKPIRKRVKKRVVRRRRVKRRRIKRKVIRKKKKRVVRRRSIKKRRIAKRKKRAKKPLNVKRKKTRVKKKKGTSKKKPKKTKKKR